MGCSSRQMFFFLCAALLLILPLPFGGAAADELGKRTLLDWKGALSRSRSLPASSRMHTWTSNSNMCYDWTGTFCNGAGQLDLLTLTGDNISGELPPELSQVTSLRSLLLSGNRFIGKYIYIYRYIITCACVELLYNVYRL